MPHLIRNNLTLRVLHDKADFFRLRPQICFVKLGIVKINFSASLALGRNCRLELTKQRRFAAAAFSAENNELALADFQVDFFKTIFIAERISEA